MTQAELVKRVSMVLSLLLAGCPSPSAAPNDNNPPDMQTDNSSDEPDNDNNNSNGEDSPDGGGSFTGLTGTELLVEGVDFDGGDGSSDRQDERFTSTFTLTVVDAETSQVFVVTDEGSVLVDRISGNLQGQAHLTYSESGTDFDPSFAPCTTSSYSGEVEWDATFEGTYDYIPAIDEITVLIPGRDLSSPEFPVTFATVGCPEFDSVSQSSYYWGGPGIGTWGGVPIVIRDGVFDSRIDNPSANDRGDEDFYEIHVESGANP